MFLNVYLSEFFWHTLMRRFCCCCLEELEVWIPYEMRFLYQLLLEEGKLSNIELRKCSQQEHLFLRIHMIKEKAWRNHGTDNYD